MRKQFLFVDQRGGDCYYPYAGNCNITQGGKGTLLLWQYCRATSYDMMQMSRFCIQADANNMVYQLHNSGICVVGQSHLLNIGGSFWGSGNRWELATYTWDFTPAAGSGIVDVYVNGVRQQHVTNVWAPQGTIGRIYVGQSTLTPTPGFPSFVQALAIWDNVMGADQIAALYDLGYRHPISPSDGTGRLTLLADFNGHYDATVAGGSGIFAYAGAADRHCLVDDGLRELGRKTFAFGMPRHDFSDSDRMPIAAAGVLTNKANVPYIGTSNQARHSEITITAGDSRNTSLNCALAIPDGPAAPSADAWGAGYSLRPPTTLRQWVQVPRDGTPLKKWVRVGPFDYLNASNGQGLYSGNFGSGHAGQVVADAGNTVTAFKTSVVAVDGTYVEGFWVGAMLQFVSGANAGRCLKVTGWSPTTRAITLEGPLPSVPSANDFFVVDHGARISGINDGDGSRIAWENLEAGLWETDGGEYAFTQLEWLWGEQKWARYDNGRTMPMQGIAHVAAQSAMGYGQPGGVDNSGYYTKVRVRRIDVDGPAEYQLVRRNAAGEGPSLGDNFMLMHDETTGAPGVYPAKRSVKTWRTSGLAYRKTQPTKIANWQGVQADLGAAGTWRNGCSAPTMIAHDDATGVATCAVIGFDPSGVARLGYVNGAWNASTGRISWSDEPAPAGKANPIGTLDGLVPPEVGDRPYAVAGVMAAPDGTWSLFLNTAQANYDHFVSVGLHGASDRWSFSASNYSRENPIPPLNGGPDAPSVYGRGAVSACANRDAELCFVANPYAKNPARRYVGYGRGKMMFRDVSANALDTRPLVGVAGADPRSLRPLPKGGALSPLPGPLIHAGSCAVLGQEDCFAVLSDTAIGATSGVGMWVSEDGVHFQQFIGAGATTTNALIPQGVLPGEPHRLSPGSVLRVGDKRVYYYYGTSFVDFAWVRWNGESNYELDSDKTSGWFETCALQRPSEGWGSLTLNVALSDGGVRVGVLDADTELPIAGFGETDCDGLQDSLGTTVTWRGAGLSEVTADCIRLHVSVSRPTTGAPSPAIYDWRIVGAVAPSPPVVNGLRVDGHANPAGISDPAPVLSWTYGDPQGLAQTMYRVVVSSSAENLGAGLGDLWDTGDVAGNETSIEYAGTPLSSGTTYFWKVRARNAKGVWSATW
jgi:hypothetical protein